jgi:thiol-disulfide isomerase/thioredoxin
MQRKHFLTILGLFLAFLTGLPAPALAGYERFLEGPLESFKLHKSPAAVPDFAFQDQGGKEVRLSAFKGQVVLVALWATWCPFCRTDMPHLNGLQGKFGGQGFTVLPISVDVKGAEAVRAYYESEQLDKLPIYNDPQSKVGTVLKAGGLPYFILIDRSGTEIGRLPGETNWMSPEAHAFISAVINGG